jgi:hypothetical protein
MTRTAWEVYFDKSELLVLKELVNRHYDEIYKDEKENSVLEDKIDLMIECLGSCQSNSIEAILFNSNNG